MPEDIIICEFVWLHDEHVFIKVLHRVKDAREQLDASDAPWYRKPQKFRKAQEYKFTSKGGYKAVKVTLLPLQIGAVLTFR